MYIPLGGLRIGRNLYIIIVTRSNRRKHGMERNVLHRHSSKKAAVCILLAVVMIMATICLFVGSSGMTVSDCFAALANKSTAANNRIIS